MSAVSLARWAAYVRLVRTASREELQRRLRRRVNGWLARAGLLDVKISDEDLLCALQGYEDISQFLESGPRLSTFFADSAERSRIVECLKQEFPNLEHQVIAEAEAICQHVFDLLGSGPVCLDDILELAAYQDVGDYLPWHTDFKSGHTWPRRQFYRHIRYGHVPGADIKVPWELSRCQHFVTLGKAYWYTGNERFAREFVKQVSSWIESNPLQLGVNWACTMDVAIRAVSWLWGYQFFSLSPTLSDDFRLQFFKSLLAHGRHIRNNLEWSETANNHYIADLVGLIHFGAALLSLFEEAGQWLEFGARELFKEMRKQVYPDGVDYEGSIAYHRLVTEMCLFGALLCERVGITVPEDMLKRLERMFEFVMSYLKPNGLAPQSGDSDDGRLVKLATFTDSPVEPWLDSESCAVLDHRYLLALGAVFFGRSDFATAAGRLHEDVVWAFGPEGVDQFHALHEHSQCFGFEGVRSRAFGQGGIFLMRDGELYLAIDAGPSRMHAHNDTLSFELVAAGVTFLVDPGTYVYTSDQHSRHWFRRTAAHNTVVVDGQEMNRIWPERVFEICDDARVVIHEWHSNEQYDLFDGEHSGYRRLAEPVIHRRQVFFDKVLGFWVIRDLILGEGEHTCEFWLHFAPAVELREQGNLALCAHVFGSDARLMVIPLNRQQLQLGLESSWVSSSYGTRKTAPVACYSKRVKAPAEFGFGLIPLREDMAVPRVVLDAATQHFATLTERHPV